jgi:hypothetical protein
MNELAKYNKFWVALTAPLGVLLFCMAPTETEQAFKVNLNELYMVAVAGAASIGVYAVPNKKG